MGVELGELKAVGSQAIHIRSELGVAAIESDLVPAHIVGEHEHYVGATSVD